MIKILSKIFSLSNTNVYIIHFSQQSSLLHMFYLSLRSSFICKGNVFYSLYSIISTFQLSISPFSKYLFPFHPQIYPNIPPHYTHFHQQFIITSTHNYFQKDLYFDPILILPSPNMFQ